MKASQTPLFLLVFTVILSLFAGAYGEWSWQEPQARVLPTGDLEWAPEPFVFDAGTSAIRYIDFEAGDDSNSGTSTNAAWKHHPWDTNAVNVAQSCTNGIYTFVFKRGVIYRGSMLAERRGLQSGEPGNPMRLTSDPSWGTGEAILRGSIALTNWVKGADSRMSDTDNVWYTDVGTNFIAQSIWEIHEGEIIRLDLARTPNWTVTNPLDPQKDWWTFTHTTRLNSNGTPWTIGESTAGSIRLLCDEENLRNYPSNHFAGATIWSEYSHNMATSHRPNEKIASYFPEHGGFYDAVRAPSPAQVQDGNRYFVEDLPHFLDAAGEFYQDKEIEYGDDELITAYYPGRIYVRLPEDRNPNESKIEMGTERYIIDIRHQHDVEVSGLTFQFNQMRYRMAWPAVAKHPSGVRIVGMCENITVANNKFDHLTTAVTAWTRGEDLYYIGIYHGVDGESVTEGPWDDVMENIIVRDNDITHMDDHGVAFRDTKLAEGITPVGYISDFKSIHVLRNRLTDIGFRQVGARQSAVSAIHVYDVMRAEIAGNIISNACGAGINVWSSKTGKGSDLRIRPFNRTLIYNNKVVNSMLAGNDYGGIEIWQGGPAYVFNNISGNAIGRRNYSWYGDLGDDNERSWNWINWGFAYYADGMYKSYVFNNIGWGAQNRVLDESVDGDIEADYEDTFMNMAMFCDVVGFQNHRFNNTAYKFALGLHLAGNKHSRHSLLGNVFADIGHQYIRGSGSLGGSSSQMETSSNNIMSIAYGHNIYHGIESGGWPIISSDWNGPTPVTIQDFEDKMADLKMRTSEAGAMATSLPLQQPDGHDYRLKLDTVAEDAGVKFFVPWGLYAMVGEWNFMANPGDVNQVIGENLYMTDEYLFRENFNDIPWNNLEAHSVTLNNYVQGDLEDWSPGALTFDGSNTYCRLTDADMKIDYEYDGHLITVTNSRGDVYQKYKKDGTSIYPGEDRMNFDMSTNNFLIEMYFKTDLSGIPLISKMSTTDGYMLDVDSSGKPRLTLRSAGTDCSRVGSVAINDGNWHHIIAEVDRVDSNEIAIYIDGGISNGAVTGTMPISSVSLTNNADLLIGKGPADDYFGGTMDFLRICRGTMADAETTIEELYAWQFDGPQARDFTGAEITDGQRDAGALEMIQNPAILTDVSSLSVSEGGTATFEVSLSAEPAGSTTVHVTHVAGDTDLSVSNGMVLVFSSITWSNSQTVTLAAAQDTDVNNSEAAIVLSSPDAYTAELSAIEVEDDLGVELSTNALNMNEEDTAGYQVRLSMQPSGTVTVSTARVSGDTDLQVTDGDSRTFTTNTWNVYQDVELSVLADDDVTNGVAVVQSSAPGLTSSDVTVTLRDNDKLMVNWPDTVTVFEGETNTFNVSLSHIPTFERSVSVVWYSGDSNITLFAGSNLVFNSVNWNVAQQVTLVAGQDDEDIDNEAVLRSHTPGFPAHLITVTAIDDDDFTPPSVTDADAPTPFSIVVMFDEPLDVTTAEMAGNYTLNYGASVLSATLDLAASNQVTLLTSELTEALVYTLVIDGVEDPAGQAMVNSSNQVAYYHYQVAKFDFGEAAYTTPGNWNNVTTNTLGVQVVDALNTDGEFSGIALEITDAFHGNSSKGVVASNLYPASAQRDGLGVALDDPSEFKLSNLDSRKPHQLTFFGSLDSSSIRTVTYAVGAESVELSNVYNTNNAVTLEDIYPDVNGEIVVQVSSGNTEWPSALFGFIGVLELQYTPPPAVEANVSSVDVPEGGANSFGVRLSSQPVATTTVTVSRVAGGDTDIALQGSSSLVFTTNDWPTWKYLELTADEDDADAENDSAIFRCEAAGVTTLNITATEIDNDEGGGTYKSYLFDFGSSSYTTPGNWNNITDVSTGVKISAATDATGSSSDGIGLETLVAFVGNTGPGEVASNLYPALAQQDNFSADTNQVSEFKLTGLIPGGACELTFFGSRMEPDRETEYSVGLDSVTLVNSYNTNNAVTLSNIYPDVNGDLTVSVGPVAGSDYGHLSVVELEVQQVADIQITTNALSVPEDGSNTFGVRLTAQPMGWVTVTVSRVTGGSSDVTVEDGDTLIFTTGTWMTEQTVTVAAADDFDRDIDTAQIRCAVSGMTDQNVDITVVENELDYIYKTLYFDFGFPEYTTLGNWNNITTHTAEVVIVDAVDSEGDVSGIGMEITADFFNVNDTAVTASNLYPETAQGDFFVVSEEENPGEFMLTGLDPSRPHDLTFFGSRTASDRYTEYSVGIDSVILDNSYNTNRSATLLEIYPDVNSNITVSVDVSDCSYANIGVLELHCALPLGIHTESTSLSIPEGDSENLNIRLTAPPTGTTTVAVSRVSNGDADITVEGSASLVFTTNDWMTEQTIVIAAGEDVDVTDGSATIRCSAAGMSSFDITVSEVDDDKDNTYQTLHFDLGDTTYETSGNWNNLTDFSIAGVVSNAVNADGDATGIGLRVTDAFRGNSGPGVVDSTLYPEDAQRDSFTVGSDDPGELKLTGLTPGKPYELIFFGSRETTQERRVEYAVGASSVILDNKNNTSNTVVLHEIVADANGNITISVARSDTNYGYLGVLEVRAPLQLAVETSVSEVGVPETGTANFGVKLNSKPDNTVTVSVDWVTGGDADISVQSGSNLVFTTIDWMIEKTVVLAAAEDEDLDNDEATIRCSSGGLLNVDVTATEVDRDKDYIYQTLYFDFGNTVDTTTGNWNNLTDVSTAGAVVAAITANGDATEIGLEISDAFSGNGGVGVDDATLYPATAQKDSFGAKNNNPGQFKLTGLNAGTPHDLTFFGSRADDDRKAAYAVGAQSVILDNANNISNTVTLANIYPDANSNITVDVTAEDFTYGYLGVLELRCVVPLSLYLSTTNVTVDEDSTANFGIRLTDEPDSTVTVTVSASGDEHVSVQSGTNLVFTTNNWAIMQYPVLAATNDADTVNGTAVITCSASGLASVYVTATENDDDTVPDLTYVIPWSETFETNPVTMAGTPGDLDGQHGWAVSGTGSATVQTNTVKDGAQALELSGATASHTYNGSLEQVWATLWIDPVEVEETSGIDTNSSAVFYVNTNSQVVAYDGTNATTLTGTTVSNDWNKFEVKLSYASDTWGLWLNNAQVVTNFAFYASQSGFQSVKILEGTTGSCYVDSISIINVAPAGRSIAVSSMMSAIDGRSLKVGSVILSETTLTKALEVGNNLIGVSLEAETLAALVGSQLLSTDQVVLYNAETSAYETYSAAEALLLTVPAGSAFWIETIVARDLVMTGAQLSAKEILLLEGLQIIASPVLEEAGLQALGLNGTGSANPGLCDKISVLVDGIYQVYGLGADGVWYRADDKKAWKRKIESEKVIEAGEGFWYDAKTPFVWSAE